MGALDAARHLRDGAAWRPANAAVFLRQVVNRTYNAKRQYSDRDHLLAAIEWLKRAQDVTGDGGICGRFRLRQGWSSSYPETTGYTVATLIAAANALGEDDLRQRASRCVDFLLPLQLSSGAFPGMEVASNRTDPSPFNTAQIINGLHTWHLATGCERSLEAARRAADWMVSIQDGDGAWRQNYYLGVAATYSAHATCWLAELGKFLREQRYLDACARHLDWVLTHVDARTGWIDLCGFDAEAHAGRWAHTHTIAYTIWGVLRTSEILNRADGSAVARTAADAVARRLELNGWLPGELNHEWHGLSNYACLTGNVQLALIWMHLYESDGDARWLNAALKAIDLVKPMQDLRTSEDAIRGGIPGSDPVWGRYMYLTVPNWPAKFFVDALLEKARIMDAIAARPRGRWAPQGKLPTALAPREGPPPTRRPTTVLYTSPNSRKVLEMMDAWSAWGYCPDWVVVERDTPVSTRSRLLRRLREDGFGWIFRRLRGKQAIQAALAASVPSQKVIPYCREHGIPVFEIKDLASAEAVKLIGDLRPCVAIHAGAGILRPSVLNIPRLGTLNAHMGILPHYRGMNVAEWAAFNGDAVGTTVHFIDSGIDTGPIVCIRRVDISACRNIADLRDSVNRAQLKLLGEVLQFVAWHDAAPSTRSQVRSEGVQFFRMHADLRRVLESDLASASSQLPAMVAAHV